MPPHKVPHTCPAIDQVKRLIRKHIDDPEARAQALALMEELRTQNSQLRDNYNQAQADYQRMIKEDYDTSCHCDGGIGHRPGLGCSD